MCCTLANLCWEAKGKSSCKEQHLLKKQVTSVQALRVEIFLCQIADPCGGEQHVSRTKETVGVPTPDLVLNVDSPETEQAGSKNGKKTLVPKRKAKKKARSPKSPNSLKSPKSPKSLKSQDARQLWISWSANVATTDTAEMMLEQQLLVTIGRNI